MTTPTTTVAIHEELWAAVHRRDEHTAASTISAALEAGHSAEAVLLDFIAPVQARIGAEWAANRIGVAQEHAATAISERLVTLLANHRSATPPATRLGRITVACVDHEWHSLPARLLAQVLTMRGWEVDFLGAQVPTPQLIRHVHQSGPDAVALSSSIPIRLPHAHAAITACQAVGMPVLVGGAAFGPDGRYARILGANAWAGDARQAAEELGKGIARPDPLADHQVAGGLPHLADQEYTLVARSRAQLVLNVLADLERRYPPMKEYTERQRQHTAEDLAKVVDFLAAALYVDVDDLFTDFLAWTADILAARGVPADSLLPTLTSLADELRDFPRCTRILSQAHRTLESRPLPTTRRTGKTA